jgi:hypothetical protein
MMIPFMVRQAIGNCSMRCPTSRTHAVGHERDQLSYLGRSQQLTVRPELVEGQ